MERTQVSIARKPAAAARSKSRPASVHRQNASVMRVLRPDAVDNSTEKINHPINSSSNNSESLLSRQCDECAEEVQKKPQQSLPAISHPSDPLELEAERVADNVMAQTDSTAYSPFATQSNAVEVQRACASCEEETEIQRVTSEPLVQLSLIHI